MFILSGGFGLFVRTSDMTFANISMQRCPERSWHVLVCVCERIGKMEGNVVVLLVFFWGICCGNGLERRLGDDP